MLNLKDLSMLVNSIFIYFEKIFVLDRVEWIFAITHGNELLH